MAGCGNSKLSFATLLGFLLLLVIELVSSSTNGYTVRDNGDHSHTSEMAFLVRPDSSNETLLPANEESWSEPSGHS